MIRADWVVRFSTLPPGLSIVQIARKIGCNYNTARLWVRKLNHPFHDGRVGAWPAARRLQRAKFNPALADWSLPNVVLARNHGVSRERIRQLRNRLTQTTI